jgi:hypothetical protein
MLRINYAKGLSLRCNHQTDRSQAARFYLSAKFTTHRLGADFFARGRNNAKIRNLFCGFAFSEIFRPLVAPPPPLEYGPAQMALELSFILSPSYLSLILS